MTRMAFRLDAPGVFISQVETNSGAGLAVHVFGLITQHRMCWCSIRYRMNRAAKHEGELGIGEDSCWSQGNHLDAFDGISDELDERCQRLFELALASGPYLLPDPEPCPF